MNDTISYKQSAGGIVHHNGKFLALEVLDYGEVVFPKGTIEPGETPEQTAVREILEETGYQVTITAPLGEITYDFTEHDQHYRKMVHYFLLKLIDAKAAPKPNRQAGENFENLWLTAEEAFTRLTHEDSKKMLRYALEKLAVSKDS
ncbi:MAG TPA: NUDIX hydrolase [Verrucomicrobiae bacterium]|nr:NUDIX hydrolase [Verrucomicrobiae bacterium]